ncbi:MAG: monovalent cation/H(+) antiporter subunit G [Burkholderiaceae bacterium]|jgi:multicomponent K+:H+ antiporter subunit G
MTIDTLPLWIAIPVAILLVISGILTLTGSLGLLRLPDFYSRIHAPTLGNTLGIFCVIVASILATSIMEKTTVFHYLLITLLLIITSPVTAMLLMRAAIRRQERAAQKAERND